MAGRRWTDDDKADIAHLIRCGFTYAEIAERYGSTRSAIESMAKREVLVKPAERNAIRSFLLKGTKRSAKTKRAISKAMKASWKEPSSRAKRCAAIRSRASTPEGKAQIAAAKAIAIRVRRGCELPDEETAESFRFLTKSKRLSVAEAARILNLPSSTSQERRA